MSSASSVDIDHDIPLAEVWRSVMSLAKLSRRIDVEHEWSLRLQSAEKSALQGMRNGC